MRRFLALSLAALLLICGTIPVVAEEEEGIPCSVPGFSSGGVVAPAGARIQPTPLPAGVYDYVCSQIRLLNPRINISDYKLSQDQLHSLMMDITNSEPEFFHLENQWLAYPDRSGTFVSSFAPTYSMNKEEYATALQYVREEAAKVIATVDPTWTPLEEALYLHDYIIAWYEYDNDLVVDDIYNFLKEGKGVCEGYQLYYMYLLNMLDIPNDYVVSSIMTHAWNRVYINEKWYNVDLTWDEPANNHMAETKHDNFLVSDQAFADHIGGVSDKECTDTTYDDYSWHDFSSAIVPLNGKWYVIMDGYICEYEPEKGESKKVFKLEERWPADTEGYVWDKYLSGLSTYKGCLIYITPKTFNAYNPLLDEYKVWGTYNGAGYLFDGVIDQHTGNYYVTVGHSRNANGVTTVFPIHEEHLPLTHKWVEEKRDEPTCLDPGTVYYRCEYNSSHTSEGEIAPTGHITDNSSVYDLVNESGRVYAHYKVCSSCGEKCELTPIVEEDLINKFKDVRKKDWFVGSVSFVVEQGLFGGMGENSFAPNVDMSRAMLVTVLWRLEGEPATAAPNTFTDVKEGMWYTTAVKWAAENDIVGGVGQGKFAPDTTITREQLATILFRYAAKKGYECDDFAVISFFPDANKVSAYAADAISWARARGIIDGMTAGDGAVCLNPRGYATRAQVATMFMRFVAYVCK